MLTREWQATNPRVRPEALGRGGEVPSLDRLTAWGQGPVSTEAAWAQTSAMQPARRARLDSRGTGYYDTMACQNLANNRRRAANLARDEVRWSSRALRSNGLTMSAWS
jgi:hypothetical protein